MPTPDCDYVAVLVNVCVGVVHCAYIIHSLKVSTCHNELIS